MSAPEPRASPVTGPALVGDWLGRRARLSPHDLAIVDTSGAGEARHIDFASLNRETNQVAHWLVEHGVRKGDRVAIVAKNRLEYLELWFACGKLGAVLQALNWRLTPAELGPLIAAAEPRLLCWDRDAAQTVADLREQPGAPPMFVALDDAMAEGDPCLCTRRTHSTDAPAPVELEHCDPWVLCYTGGTTGRPKAAILTHGTITWNAINTVASWGLSSTDVAVLNAPMFHTGGLNVFTAPLIHAGGCSILCRQFELESLYDLLERADPQITCLFGVPAMFQAMQTHPRWARAPLERLKLIISGGAPCPQPVFEKFWSRDIDFKTGYGLTEAGPNNFWLPRAMVRERPGAVGWPLMHVEIRIVDEAGRLCGPDEVGELWIRGPHVSPGYHRDPEATAASFVEGWLHTGDLASADADGCVRIAGRSKDMIISGGENIYPAEVESVISAHPGVAEVALIGVPDERWGEVGRAIVVRAAGAEAIDEPDVQEFLRARLAKYKVPKRVVFVDSLARTGAGKIDKPALLRAYGEDEEP